MTTTTEQAVIESLTRLTPDEARQLYHTFAAQQAQFGAALSELLTVRATLVTIRQYVADLEEQLRAAQAANAELQAQAGVAAAHITALSAACRLAVDRANAAQRDGAACDGDVLQRFCWN